MTIRPVMDFDEDIFYRWILEIRPEGVWIRYNSHPTLKLPEPSLEKTIALIERLRGNGIAVKEKLIRDGIK